MEYMLLIFSDPTGFEAIPRSQQAEGMAAYGAYNEALRKAGAWRGANRLQSNQSTTTVRVKSGATEVLNGPFCETREQLGGYYLIEAPDLDAALAWASRCPGAHHGIVEVRPVVPNGVV